MRTGLLLLAASLSALASAQTPQGILKNALPNWGVSLENGGMRFQFKGARGVWIEVQPGKGDLAALASDSATAMGIKLQQKDLVDTVGGKVVMAYGKSGDAGARSLILSGAPNGQPEVVTLYAQDE